MTNIHPRIQQFRDHTHNVTDLTNRVHAVQHVVRYTNPSYTTIDIDALSPKTARNLTRVLGKAGAINEAFFDAAKFNHVQHMNSITVDPAYAVLPVIAVFDDKHTAVGTLGCNGDHWTPAKNNSSTKTSYDREPAVIGPDNAMHPLMPILGYKAHNFAMHCRTLVVPVRLIDEAMPQCITPGDARHALMPGTRMELERQIADLAV